MPDDGDFRLGVEKREQAGSFLQCAPMAATAVSFASAARLVNGDIMCAATSTPFFVNVVSYETAVGIEQPFSAFFLYDMSRLYQLGRAGFGHDFGGNKRTGAGRGISLNGLGLYQVKCLLIGVVIHLIFTLITFSARA